MAVSVYFDVISVKFNALGTCTSGNYAQKWISILHNFQFIFHV